MVRRRPLSLPHGEQVPELAALLEPCPGAVEPDHPERFVDAALHHKVEGYAAAALERGTLILPPGPARRLAHNAAIQAVHSAALERELAAIDATLRESCGVPPVCIKGPAVARRLHSEPRLRSFMDLDLLVPREAIGAAVCSLEGRGYRTMEELRPHFGERYGHDVHLLRWAGQRGLDVEVHWRVGDDPICARLDYERLTPAATLNVAGADVGVLAMPEQIVCLAVHLLSDRMKCLIWIQDLALAVRSVPEPDWRRSFELAHELELGWALHRALDYAAHHLGAHRDRPLPAGPAPAWGPLRAVEELDMRASTHLGRLASLPWGERASYLGKVLVPTREGLRGTVGRDGAPTWRLVGRHVQRAVLGLSPRRG